ncbi:protease SohB [Candidatus Providencia siddallii]|uniref:Probable protease SohB n=1 Tax=Candidatus Providencia siddallii TaxID=1715285 RepID=A0ABP1CDK3_9GAMM
MEYLSLYGLFLAKIFTIVILVVLIVFFTFGIGIKRYESKGFLKIIKLNKKYLEYQRKIKHVKMNDSEKKIWLKKIKKQQKLKLKNRKNNLKLGNLLKKPCLYVLDFKGSINANEVISLREEITAILSVIEKEDEVLLRLESSGGIVSAYGLAASQLMRIKEKNIPLTIVVDKIAASGGYMMACIADTIIAAPFSIIGSIGVVAQIPNFYKLLKKYNIDIELHTAGEYKRTLTLLGKNTEEGRKKFIEDLNSTHKLFKDFVHKNRPLLDIESLSTGEYWYGQDALNKGLIDKIGVSDDIIMNSIKNKKVISINYSINRKILYRLTDNITKNINKFLWNNL